MNEGKKTKEYITTSETRHFLWYFTISSGFLAHKAAHVSLAIDEDATEGLHQVWQTEKTDNNAAWLGMRIKRHL